MKCAPVLIVTLNRYSHLRRCIESLQRNKLAKDTDLYIGLDYPPGQEYEAGYEQVLNYLNGGIDGFHEVVIVKQSVNKGIDGNFKVIQNAAYEKYDRYIYSEDDNEFSSNFLEYMNRSLEKYNDDDTILAVAGYNYPIGTTLFKGNVFKCETYFAAYGYGIWKQKEEEMRKHLNMSVFLKLYKDNGYMKELARKSKNQYVNMVKGMLKYTPDLIYGDQLRQVDLSYGLYMAASGMKMVYPVISKVRNWGYDGTGVNCGEVRYKQSNAENHRNFNFEKQVIDLEPEFGVILEDTEITPGQIDRLLDEYFCISGKEYTKTKAAYLLSRIVGLDRAQRMMRRE